MKQFFIAFIFITILTISWAQTPTDADFFVREGISYYNKGLLDEAQVDFENALILDKNNFEARLWLAQIYTDLKRISQALVLLREAAIQAPDHPKVLQLTELLADIRENKADRARQTAADPIMEEVIEDLQANEQLRPFGLVIPEDKVLVKNPEIAFALDLDRERDETFKQEEKIDFQSYFKQKKGPLGDVLELEQTKGITAAIELYVNKVLANPKLASEDDEGLLQRGNDIFATRFADNPKNPENRFYYGVLQYINGDYLDSEEALLPMKGKEGRYFIQLKPIFLALEKWRRDEDERMRIAKKAEEERLRLERLAREQEKNKKTDVWDELKKKRAGVAVTPDTEEKHDDSPSEKAIASALHTQGYDLYKKGKLDEAIVKYNESLEKDDKNYECIYHLGLAWTDKGLSGEIGAFDRAIGYFKTVVANDTSGKYTAEANSMINDINNAKATMGE